MDQRLNTDAAVFGSSVRELRRNWVWLLVMGILLILLGIVALVDAVEVTVVSMFLFGWVLLIAGILEAVQAFRH